MSNLILSINAGSSSLKISLFRRGDDKANSNDVKLLLTSSMAGISSNAAIPSFKPVDSDGESVKDEQVDKIKDHGSAFAHFLAVLGKDTSVDREEIYAVCHRVVHGGTYEDAVLITKETFNHIEELSDLAPLHNGSALSLIEATLDALPKAKSVAFFDTCFHQSIPPEVYSYAISPSLARKKGLRKYGFHGLSYSFVVGAVFEHLQKPVEDLNLIVLHLGSGASACAIRGGKSIDTSMGLTPVDGLPGATRSGSIDPSLIFHYTPNAQRISHSKGHTRELEITEAEEVLNKESGWKALTGTTDFGEIIEKASSSAEHALAFDLFVDQVLNFVGAYYLKLDGKVDALVFAGGIGEKSEVLRRVIGEKVRCLGFSEVDSGKNRKVDQGEGTVLSVGGKEDSKKSLVCRTDEQLEMAKQCVGKKF